MIEYLPFIEHEATGSIPNTPQRVGLSTGPKTTTASSAAAPSSTMQRNASKVQTMTNLQIFNKTDVIPVVVSKTSAIVEKAAESRKNVAAGREISYTMQPKLTDHCEWVMKSLNAWRESWYLVVAFGCIMMMQTLFRDDF